MCLFIKTLFWNHYIMSVSQIYTLIPGRMKEILNCGSHANSCNAKINIFANFVEKITHKWLIEV